MKRLILTLLEHRTAALLRWDVHFARVRLRNALTGTSRRARADVRARPQPLFLNLGSGPRGIASPRWVNVDGFRDRNVDYCLDLNRTLPFDDGRFDGVFSEHVLEHFDQEHGLRVFRECLRVLRPGGWLRIIVPDGERIMRAYFEEPDALVSRRKPESGVPMDAVNSYFRQRYEHQCLYDWAYMEHTLRVAGYTDVTRASYREGRAPAEMLIDDPKYEWESLYVDARKP